MGQIGFVREPRSSISAPAPPSGDRIHSAALPPRQRSTPTPDAFGQPPVKRGLQPRARPGPRPKVLNAFACLAPHAGPLLRRPKRVNRRFLRGDAMRTFEENRPYVEPGRSRRAFPRMDLKARRRAPRSRLDPHHGIPDEVAARCRSFRRIARARDEGMIDAAALLHR